MQLCNVHDHLLPGFLAAVYILSPGELRFTALNSGAVKQHSTANYLKVLWGSANFYERGIGDYSASSRTLIAGHLLAKTA